MMADGGERPGLRLRTLDFVMAVLRSQGEIPNRGEGKSGRERRCWRLGDWGEGLEGEDKA